MQARVRARHETLNGWQKFWVILSQVLKSQHHATWPCVLGMRGGDSAHHVEIGKQCFEVEYKDQEAKTSMQ
jgi:hypothetical protein